MSIRYVPSAPDVVPVEAKLGQLLANLGAGLLLELDPNPLADNFRGAVNVGEVLEQEVQHLGCR